MKKISTLLLLAGLAAACSDDSADPTAAGGKGTATFTTWGEEFIEEGIPAGDGTSGFVDGWSLKYEKFLVVFGGITVADLAGKQVAAQSGTRMVNNVKKAPKTLVVFPDLLARAYERVSYKIVPATAQTAVDPGDEADRDFMAKNGYAFYAEGTATKGSVKKTFKWGFARSTSYVECKAERGGKETEGAVVTSGGDDVNQLTTHGDHLFYDRLQADPSGKIPTNLRFDAIAAADDNNDGEVTLDELAKAPLDLKLGYDPSGLPAINMKDFITELTRTIGHYRGEGECSIKPE